VNPQTAHILVNGLAVAGIGIIGGLSMWAVPGAADKIALAAVSTLGGFIGGSSATALANHMAGQPANPPPPEGTPK
jgi:hypothetical protein